MRLGDSTSAVAVTTVRVMDVTADDTVVAHVADHGGVLWIRVRRQRCCRGVIATLSASTSEPRNGASYEELDTGLPFSVRLLAGPVRPSEIQIELRGLRGRQRPVAYWDGAVLRV